MDDLLKALTEAVRSGSALAAPALYGYYALRIVEALCVPITFAIVVGLITRCVLQVNQLVQAGDTERVRIGRLPR